MATKPKGAGHSPNLRKLKQIDRFFTKLGRRWDKATKSVKREIHDWADLVKRVSEFEAQQLKQSKPRRTAGSTVKVRSYTRTDASGKKKKVKGYKKKIG